MRAQKNPLATDGESRFAIALAAFIKRPQAETQIGAQVTG
jgi:hypothetical protein